jgi:hypothetical protein
VAALATGARAATDESDVDALERGVALFDKGDLPAAAQALEEAHAVDPEDVDTGLLLGIVYYRQHRFAEAQPLLLAAEASTDDETVASARIFLALIAMEHEDDERAHDLLDRVARSPAGELASSARALLAHAAPAPLTVLFGLRPELDSNVPLLPSGQLPADGEPTAQADADLLALGALSVRPSTEVPFTIDATLSYRRQARLTDYDFFSATGTLRYDGRPIEASVAGEAMVLGGAAYAYGARGDLTYHVELADAVTPYVRYGLRWRDYPADAYAGYTGPTHAVGIGVGLGPRTGPLRGELGYLLTRELTDDVDLVATNHGATGVANLRIGRVDATLAGAATWRRFDTGRRDTQGTVDASCAIELTGSVGLVAGASLVRNQSSDPAFDYWKVMGFAGAYLAL